MKAKLRKAQKEKLKQSKYNLQSSKNESQSQSQIQNQSEIDNNKLMNESDTNIEVVDNINKNLININSEKDEVKSLQKDLNPNQITKNKDKDEYKDKKPINEEEYKEQELSKIATMFNFEIDKDKKIINIKENDEYYDMRKQIKELEIELEKTKQEYEDVIQQNKRDTENQKEQIEELENELKRQVEFDIEKSKKENIILIRDINILDKKLDSINALYKKEEYDMNSTINELDNTIRKLKGEIFFVEDLKLRLKNLKNKDIPQEIGNSINFNFNIKEDNEEIKDINDTSKFGIVKSKTGSIPITDILDFSSIDSKRSVKKL